MLLRTPVLYQKQDPRKRTTPDDQSVSAPHTANPADSIVPRSLPNDNIRKEIPSAPGAKSISKADLDHILLKKYANIIDKLYDPDYIIYQVSGRNKGYYAVVLKLDDETLVSVDIDNSRRGKEAVNGENGRYNVVITAFVPSEPEPGEAVYIENLIKKTTWYMIKNEVSSQVALADTASRLKDDTSSKNQLRTRLSSRNFRYSILILRRV